MVHSPLPVPLDMFDSVIFLTQSNWFTEPRSNRYHYASRFAAHLPVYFVQFDSETGKVWSEPSGTEGITIVHALPAAAPASITEHIYAPALTSTVQEIARLGGHRPLVWVYNPYCATLLKLLNPVQAIYHASEIYLSDGDNIYSKNRAFLEYLEGCVKDLIHTVDLIFPVSDGVFDSLANTGLCTDKLVPNYNGVDAAFWLGLGAMSHVPQDSGRPMMLYQGGVNDRLDFALMLEVCTQMSDWDFWFCGAEGTSSQDWRKIKALSNVTAFGALTLEEIGAKAKHASSAWAPFVQVPQIFTSMPLKMYEYAACGLPVIAAPIRGLLGSDPRLFRFAEIPDAYITAIRDAAQTRTDPDALALREAAAHANSYDAKFDLALGEINKIRQADSSTKSILVLYDDKYATLPAIDWHLRSFSRYSRNQVFYVPASIADGMTGHHHFFPLDTGKDLKTGRGHIWDFSLFDAIVVHFSLRTTIDGYIPQFLVDRLAEFGGPKILFIQDEYDFVEMTWDYIRQMGITDVFTCVPQEGLAYTYPAAQVPGLSFERTLTGYIPEDTSFEKYALPLAERSIQIGYRGRQLPHHYGMLGHEKMIIGQRIKAEAEARGLLIDVETDDSKRIYTGWHQFLGSCRATLGTESGCNIFDFDDSLRKKALKMANTPFEEVYEAHFKAHEASFEMNQISPKFFEAIMLRTALICFPGTYSGILERDVHYIALEKDFSNLDAVFEKLGDDAFLEAMTDRAYKDVVGSGRYTYARFIHEFDDWLDRRLPFGGGEIIMAPVAVRRRGRVSAIQLHDQRDYVVTSAPLGGRVQRHEFRALFDVYRPGKSKAGIVSEWQIRKQKLRMMVARMIPAALRPLAKRVYGALLSIYRKSRK